MTTSLTRTVVAETRAELEVLVQQAIAHGWVRIGNPNQLLIGGKQVEGRAKWQQVMRRKK
ncbi:MAG: hypothetical protein ABR961_03285 [Thermoanaerobaculaceae bacterium]|jgi:hypothetical protein